MQTIKLLKAVAETTEKPAMSDSYPKFNEKVIFHSTDASLPL